MEVWIALIGGIIIGWLVEWVIDWQYWRRGLPGFYANEAELRAALAKSETDKAVAIAASAQCAAQLSDLRSRLDTLTRTESGARRSLEAALRDNAHLKERLSAAQGASRSPGMRPLDQSEYLGKIVGIGPVYEQTLFEAGIRTYAQLAALTVEELRAIIRPAAWQNIDFSQWIREAQALAAQQENAAGSEAA